MHILIAGIVLLLSFIVGVGAYSALNVFEKFNTENNTKKEYKAISAIAISNAVKKCGLKQLLFIIAVSFICAFAALLSYNAGASFFDLSRQITVALLLFAAMIIDSKTHLIPNALILLSLGVGVLILLLELIFSRNTFLESLGTGAIGLIACTAIFYILSRLTKEGIGMGDVKLISAMGFLLGLSAAMISVLFSLIICMFASVILIFGKKKNKNDRVPFGPFMFFGYIFMFILFSI